MAKKKEATKVAPKVEQPKANLEPWAVDIRSDYPDKVTQKDIDTIVEQLESNGRYLAQLFCKDEQIKNVRELKLPANVTLERN